MLVESIKWILEGIFENDTDSINQHPTYKTNDTRNCKNFGRIYLQTVCNSFKEEVNENPIQKNLPSEKNAPKHSDGPWGTQPAQILIPHILPILPDGFRRFNKQVLDVSNV